MKNTSLNVNVTDEDKSKRIIVHEILSENSYTDISKSKRNIVNETLSQNNSANVSEYTIAELKEKEYKEPSVTKELKSYFNILECGRNILDRLDVRYQKAFMATPQDKYYTRMLKNLVKMNDRNSETFSNEKLRKAVSDVREETEAEHGRNINDITCDASFKSPPKKKDISTINDSVYYESDEQVDTISDSNKQVVIRSDPMADTKIMDRVCNLSVGFGLSEPAVIGGSIGPVTHFLENFRVEISFNILSPLNTNTSKAFMIGSAFNSVGVNRNILYCTSPDRTIRNYSRIGTPGVNEGVFSPSRNTTSGFTKWTGNIEPSDTSVHGSATQERNLD